MFVRKKNYVEFILLFPIEVLQKINIVYIMSNALQQKYIVYYIFSKVFYMECYFSLDVELLISSYFVRLASIYRLLECFHHLLKATDD